MLEGLALFGAARVAREQVRHLRQHLQQRGGRRGARGHGAAEPPQEQDGRRLAGVVGALPIPRAFGIAAAECLLHRSAEPRGIDPSSTFKVRKQQLRGVQQGGRMIGSFGRTGEERGSGSRDSGGRRHEGSLGG